MPVPAYAAARGINRRTITRLIGRGLPAKKRGGRWQVEPANADAWIEANSTRLARREPGPRLDLAATATASPPRTGPSIGAGRHIEQLDQVLAAFIEVLSKGEFDARAVAGVKQICAELRQLERHRFEMRRAEDQLIERTQHERIVGTIGRVVADEVDAFGAALPDAVLAALSAAGIDLPGDPALLLHALTAAGERAARGLRGRIADSIEAVSSAADAP